MADLANTAAAVHRVRAYYVHIDRAVLPSNAAVTSRRRASSSSSSKTAPHSDAHTDALAAGRTRGIAHDTSKAVRRESGRAGSCSVHLQASAANHITVHRLRPRVFFRVVTRAMRSRLRVTGAGTTTAAAEEDDHQDPRYHHHRRHHHHPDDDDPDVTAPERVQHQLHRRLRDAAVNGHGTATGINTNAVSNVYYLLAEQRKKTFE